MIFNFIPAGVIKRDKEPVQHNLFAGKTQGNTQNLGYI